MNCHPDPVEPGDRTDLCAACSSGDLCVAHSPIFAELVDGPGYAAPSTWGVTYTVGYEPKPPRLPRARLEAA